MASIKLRGRDGELTERLPKVCMFCGEPSAQRIEKKFTWNPGWVHVLILAGVVPYLIVLVVTQKAMRVRVPVCKEHKSPWLWYNVVQGVAVIVFIGLMILLGVLCGMAEDHGDGWAGFICLLGFGSVLGFLILALGLHLWGKKLIHPEEITDRTITLGGVSEEFYESFFAEDEEDVEDEPRPRKRRSRDD